MNTYTVGVDRLVNGNTIGHEDLESIRNQIAQDVKQLAGSQRGHWEQVSALRDAADRAIMADDGCWEIRGERLGDSLARYGTCNPDTLHYTADRLEANYESVDKHERIVLFRDIYDSDREITNRGLYETYDNGFIAGRAELVDDALHDVIAEQFGKRYDNYVAQRIQKEAAKNKRAQSSYGAEQVRNGKKSYQDMTTDEKEAYINKYCMVDNQRVIGKEYKPVPIPPLTPEEIAAKKRRNEELARRRQETIDSFHKLEAEYCREHGMPIPDASNDDGLIL